MIAYRISTKYVDRSIDPFAAFGFIKSHHMDRLRRFSWIFQKLEVCPPLTSSKYTFVYQMNKNHMCDEHCYNYTIPPYLINTNKNKYLYS